MIEKLDYDAFAKIVREARKKGTKPTLGQCRRHFEYVMMRRRQGHVNERLYPYIRPERMPRPQGKIYRDYTNELDKLINCIDVMTPTKENLQYLKDVIIELKDSNDLLKKENDNLRNKAVEQESVIRSLKNENSDLEEEKLELQTILDGPILKRIFRKNI